METFIIIATVGAGFIFLFWFILNVREESRRLLRKQEELLSKIEEAQGSWRKVIATAVMNGIWVPAFSTALEYFDGYRNERLPANLLQAQRDYFGAHTYERTDKPRGEFSHTNWTGRGGDTASSTYTV